MPRQPPIAPQTEIPTGDLDRLHNLIRRRAYEIFLSRAPEAGTDLGDWLRAEQELASLALTAEAAIAPDTGLGPAS